MPSLGTVRTLDLDVQSRMWDNLLLLMTRPTGGEPRTLPGPGQQDVDVGCFAHPGSPSGRRTLEKENYEY